MYAQGGMGGDVLPRQVLLSWIRVEFREKRTLNFSVKEEEEEIFWNVSIGNLGRRYKM